MFFFHCWVINSLDHSHALVRVAAKLGLLACCTCQKSMCHGDSLTVMKESVWCGNHCSRTDELMTCFSFCSYYQDTSPLPQHLEPLGRSKEESEKNSWVYKFSLRQPSAGSSSPPHTHLDLQGLGWGCSEGKLEEKREGAIAQHLHLGF